MKEVFTDNDIDNVYDQRLLYVALRFKTHVALLLRAEAPVTDEAFLCLVVVTDKKFKSIQHVGLTFFIVKGQAVNHIEMAHSEGAFTERDAAQASDLTKQAACLPGLQRSNDEARAFSNITIESDFVRLYSYLGGDNADTLDFGVESKTFGTLVTSEVRIVELDTMFTKTGWEKTDSNIVMNWRVADAV